MEILKFLAANTLDFGALESVTTPAIPNTTPGYIVGTLVRDYVFPIAGFLTLGMAVVGGFQHMLSYGDTKKVTAAKEKITYGIIGFIVIFSSWWGVKIVGQIFDIKAIQDIFK